MDTKNSSNTSLPNLQISESELIRKSLVLDNSKNLLTTILDFQDAWVLVTAFDNENVLYANKSAQNNFYDLQTLKTLNAEDYNLFEKIKSISISDSNGENVFEHYCHNTNSHIEIKSFPFYWSGSECTIHYMSEIINHKLYVDDLTGLYNRLFCLKSIERLILSGEQFSLAMVDIDGLNDVNQKFGYEHGDKYLLFVVEQIKRFLRKTDMLTRIGSDEFIIILPECSKVDASKKMYRTNHLIRSLSTTYPLSISYGSLEVCQDDNVNVDDIDNLLTKCEDLMQEYKKTHKASNSEKQTLNDEIREQEFIDANFNIPNFTQYNIDNDVFSYDKICVVRVETADISIAVLGKDKYNASIRDAISQLQSFVFSKNFASKISFYSFDSRTILISSNSDVSNDDFLKIVREMSDKFTFVSSDEAGLSSVTRFAVVLEQENLVEVGITLLIQNQHNQRSFMIYDDDSKISLVSESQTIALLKRSITENLVTPFYQGIRNNSNGKIDFFEALIRIVDGDKIYSPKDFLETATKYKFYERMMYLMLKQVFADFSNRTENVSVNVTIADIESEKFRNWFLKEIVNFKNRKNLIVELVESENYDQNQNNNIVREFIDTVRDLGVQIAIDDFGSGYSTLSKIIDIKPDIIKIDGSIVRNVSNDQASKKILELIVSMAKILDSNIVAEYIENESIQSVVEKFNIKYSQGFFYTKPRSFENIDNYT